MSDERATNGCGVDSELYDLLPKPAYKFFPSISNAKDIRTHLHFLIPAKHLGGDPVSFFLRIRTLKNLVGKHFTYTLNPP